MAGTAGQGKALATEAWGGVFSVGELSRVQHERIVASTKILCANSRWFRTTFMDNLSANCTTQWKSDFKQMMWKHWSSCSTTYTLMNLTCLLCPVFFIYGFRYQSGAFFLNGTTSDKRWHVYVAMAAEMANVVAGLSLWISALRVERYIYLAGVLT